MIDNEDVWFAVRTRAKHEIILRDFFQKINIVCYLPTCTVLRQYANYRTKKIEKPLVNNLLFVKTSKHKIFSVINEYGIKISLIRNKAQQFITVPEKQMDDFIRMAELMKEDISVDTDTFVSGDKVRVIDGPLAGVEGELVKIKGRHHLVIRIQEVTALSLKVPKKIVEKII